MEELNRTLEDVLRREKGRVVGALVRTLGSIDAAEEAFQEAVLAALPNWQKGAPANPAAWLTTAAKNYARDAARHRRIVDANAPLLVEKDMAAPATFDSISDDELRLIFTCCHPALTLDSQVALTLKVVAGLTSDEIARAFLRPEKRPRILGFYDELLALTPSPVVALNRAVAVSMLDGPAAGLAALAALQAPLSGYHLFYALRADCRARLGQDARDDYRRALELTNNESERRFLKRKIDEVH